jgi:hypothetical protein
LAASEEGTILLEESKSDSLLLSTRQQRSALVLTVTSAIHCSSFAFLAVLAAFASVLSGSQRGLLPLFVLFAHAAEASELTSYVVDFHPSEETLFTYLAYLVRFQHAASLVDVVIICLGLLSLFALLRSGWLPRGVNASLTTCFAALGLTGLLALECDLILIGYLIPNGVAILDILVLAHKNLLVLGLRESVSWRASRHLGASEAIPSTQVRCVIIELTAQFLLILLHIHNHL